MTKGRENLLPKGTKFGVFPGKGEWNLFTTQRHIFTQRVIGGYRRFLYLAMVAGNPVTPSDEVDQVWHLHLCYTDSYWRELCGETLGRPLHHGPTKGGKKEGEKFANWYEKTLASYLTEFGKRAPVDVWPAAERRFGAAVHFQRINARENLIIPIAALRRIGVAVLAVSLVAVTGCQLLGDGRVFRHGNNEFLTPFLVVLVIVVVISAAIRFFRGGGRGGGKGGGGGCGGCGGSSCSSGCSGHSGCGSGCGGGCGGD